MTINKKEWNAWNIKLQENETVVDESTTDGDTFTAITKVETNESDD